MGARHAEFALGLWLLASPVILGHLGAEPALVASDLVAAGILLVVPLLCYVRRLHRAHLLLLPLAGWLMGYGWWRSRVDPHAAAQNELLVGLCLAMVAVIPSRALDVPTGWRRFYEREASGKRDARRR